MLEEDFVLQVTDVFDFLLENLLVLVESYVSIGFMVDKTLLVIMKGIMFYAFALLCLDSKFKYIVGLFVCDLQLLLLVFFLSLAQTRI